MSLGSLRTGFSALQHRNYRIFWLGQVFSLVGAWMQTIAQSWLVLELTESTFLVGLVVAIQFFPVLIFGLFGGVFADRFDKRRTLMGTQSLAALQALALGVLVVSGVVQVGHVMVLAGLLGLVNAVDMPTRQSFVTEMVGKRDVSTAVALNSSAFNLARIVGPAIGGVLIARFGVAPTFFLNAVSFAGVLVALLRMRPEELHRGIRSEERNVLRSMRKGLRYMRTSRVASSATALVGVVATFGMNFGVLLPDIARTDFAIGSSGFGLLMSSLGVGSLLAGLFLAGFSRLSPKTLMLGGAIGFSVLELIFSFLPSLGSVPLASAILVLLGFSTICMTATANTTIQRTSPDELRGRVMSIYIAIFAGSMPVGSLFAGSLAKGFGAPWALGAGAVLSGGGAAWAWWRLREWSGSVDLPGSPGVVSPDRVPRSEAESRESEGPTSGERNAGGDASKESLDVPTSIRS